MTRGKHGISAAARNAVSERDQQIASYQHNIRKLTAENAELKQKIADMQAAHSKTVRELKAQRDEGLSPMVTALQQENGRLKEKAEKAKSQIRKIQRVWNNASERLFQHFETAHGLPRVQAMEAVFRLGPDFGDDDLYNADDLDPKRFKPADVERIQRARGERR